MAVGELDVEEGDQGLGVEVEEVRWRRVGGRGVFLIVTTGEFATHFHQENVLFLISHIYVKQHKV